METSKNYLYLLFIYSLSVVYLSSRRPRLE